MPGGREPNEVLAANSFDRKVEQLCQRYYQPVMGRPSLAPGVDFGMLLLGYCEGLESERGIAWRVADSLSLREFVGLRADAGPYLRCRGLGGYSSWKPTRLCSGGWSKCWAKKGY